MNRRILTLKRNPLRKNPNSGSTWRLTLLFIIPALAAFVLSIAGCKNDAQPVPQLRNFITIHVVHSPEIRAFLSSMKEQFDGTHPKLSDGREVRLELINQAALSSATDIARGVLKTEGWLAPSSSLVNFANNELSNLGPRQKDCRQIFATPIVVASLSQNKEFFGADSQKFSWNEFFDSKLGAESNAKQGSSNVAFYHGSPLHSSAGFASLLQLAYLAAPTIERTLDADTLTNPKTISKLKTFGSWVSSYGVGESYILDRVASSVGSRIRFAFTTEQELANFNMHQKPGEPLLTALYPVEGSLWLDYNLCVSDADWVTPAHRAGLQLWTDFLSSKEAQLAAKRKGFRPSAVQFGDVEPLVTKFGVDTNQPENSFQPAPGPVASYLVKNWGKLMRAGAVVLVMDTSGSMSGESLSRGKEQFRKILAILPNEDFKALVSINSEPKTEVDWTKDSKKVIQAIDKLNGIGGSAVYDSIKQAIDLLDNDEVRGMRKTVLVFTDGDDKNSLTPLQRFVDNISDRSNGLDFNLIIVGITKDNIDYSDLKKATKAAHGIFRESTLVDMDTLFADLLRVLS